MSAEMFGALVTARLRPVEGVVVQGGKGLQLRLQVNGKETVAQLERYYERYRADRENLNQVIQEFVSALVRGTSDSSAGNASFALVRDQLQPRLMTSHQWMTRRDQGLRLVVRSIAQDLGTALIVDRGESFEYVQLDAIPAWEIDSQTAYEIAEWNLQQHADRFQTTVNGSGVATLLVTRGQNASALILLAARLAEWQAHIEGTLVLALPTHDLVLGFSRAHPAFEDLRAQVHEDAASPGGLLGNLLLVTQGGLELLPN